jgi:hypothetical protein
MQSEAARSATQPPPHRSFRAADGRKLSFRWPRYEVGGRSPAGHPGSAERGDHRSGGEVRCGERSPGHGMTEDEVFKRICSTSPVHSVLFEFSALPFQYVALRSALFMHKVSHCVSGSDKPWRRT